MYGRMQAFLALVRVLLPDLLKNEEKGPHRTMQSLYEKLVSKYCEILGIRQTRAVAVEACVEGVEMVCGSFE